MRGERRALKQTKRKRGSNSSHGSGSGGINSGRSMMSSSRGSGSDTEDGGASGGHGAVTSDADSDAYGGRPRSPSGARNSLASEMGGLGKGGPPALDMGVRATLATPAVMEYSRRLQKVLPDDTVESHGSRSGTRHRQAPTAAGSAEGGVHGSGGDERDSIDVPSHPDGSASSPGTRMDAVAKDGDDTRPSSPPGVSVMGRPPRPPTATRSPVPPIDMKQQVGGGDDGNNGEGEEDEASRMQQLSARQAHPVDGAIDSRRLPSRARARHQGRLKATRHVRLGPVIPLAPHASIAEAVPGMDMARTRPATTAADAGRGHKEGDEVHGGPHKQGEPALQRPSTGPAIAPGTGTHVSHSTDGSGGGSNVSGAGIASPVSDAATASPGSDSVAESASRPSTRVGES